MEREMAFHVDSLARDYARDGLSDVDAQRAARRQFGNLTRLKERGHDERTMRVVEDVTRDVRHGGSWSLAQPRLFARRDPDAGPRHRRQHRCLLRRRSAPAAAAAVPGRRPARDGRRVSRSPRTIDVSPANWLDWQRESRTFRGFAAWQSASFTMIGAGEPRRVNAQLVSSEFFPLLGVAPLLGRTISAEDDRPNGPRVAVLSYRAWQDQLGGDRRAIGRTVQLNEPPVRDRGRDARRLSLRAAGCRPVDRISARPEPPVAGDRRTHHRRRRTPRRRRNDRHGPIGNGRHRAASRRDAHVQQEHERDNHASARGAHRRGADVGARAVRRRGRAARHCLLQRRQHAPGAIGVAPARDRDSRVTRGGTLGDCAIAAGRKPAARRRRRRARPRARALEPRRAARRRPDEPARRLRAVHRSTRPDVRVRPVARDRRDRRPRTDDPVRAAIDGRRVADARVEGRSRAPCATGARRRAGCHDGRAALRRRCPRSHAHRARSGAPRIRCRRRPYHDGVDLAGAISRRAPPRLLSPGADAPSRVAGHRIRGRGGKPADGRHSSRRNEVS